MSEISEKAFYFCKNLKSVKICENTLLKGENVFADTDPNFEINKLKNGKTVLVSDIHGHLRLDFLSAEVDKHKLTSADVLIILGDAGIVWSDPMNEDVIEFYSKLKCTVLFLDGNHENFDLLNNLSISSKYGGRVHEVIENVYHLLRGEAYLINCCKYFVFGGAYSIKKETDASPVYIWDEEMPDDTDYKNGYMKLEENNYTFDYILSNQAPKSILDKINYSYSKNELPLLDYLDEVKATTNFSKWFFGHIHKDLEIAEFKSIYEKSESI